MSAGSLGRFSPAELSDEQRRVRDLLAQGARGAVPKPYHIWISSPGLVEHLERLGLYLLKDSGLTPREVEIAILVAGRHWGAAYVLHAHSRIGARVGLPETVIAALRSGAPPDLTDPREQAVHDVAAAAHRAGPLPRDVFDRAHRALGDRGLCDLMGLLGYYASVAFTLNAYDVPAPAGAPEGGGRND